MVSNELKDLLIHVITSWQVITIMLVLILYFSLVSYVAKFRRKKARKYGGHEPKPRKEKPSPAAPEKDSKESEEE